MPSPLQLSPQQRQLVDDYASWRERAGMSPAPVLRWPALAFCARVGSPETWLALSLEEQRALHRRIRTFVGWLIVTQRLAVTADYLVV